MTMTQTRKPEIPVGGAPMQGRYQTSAQHDISRCERGLSPILGAVCRCDGYAFFAQLPPTDLHSFRFGEETLTNGK